MFLKDLAKKKIKVIKKLLIKELILEDKQEVIILFEIIDYIINIKKIK